MKRRTTSFLKGASVETDMIWGILSTLLGFVLLIVITSKVIEHHASSALSIIGIIIGVIVLFLGLAMYGRALFKVLK